jgi:methyl-accepting chemotaxis protein
MFLKNLRIATKLWMAVAAIVLTLIASFVGGNLLSAGLQLRMDARLAELNLRVRTMNHWYGLTQSNAIRALAAVTSSDPNVDALFKGPIAETSKQISAVQKEIEAMTLDDREKAQLAAVAVLRKKVLAIRAQALAEKKAGNLEQALRTLNNDYTPASDTYLKAIAATVQLEEGTIDRFKAEIADARADIRRNGILLVSALSVLILAGAFFLIRSIRGPLREAIEATDKIANGYLDIKLDFTHRDEFGELSQSLNRMISSVSAIVATVGSNAVLVAHAGRNQSADNQVLSNRTVEQAASLEQTTASVQDVALAVQQNAATARHVDEKAVEVRVLAENGTHSMHVCVESVDAIQHTSHQMNEIVGVIDDLAFQTNILSLNAAVEAARAGESGRGFAVVAKEVRSLAQRSAESAREVRNLINASAAQVEASVALMRGAEQAMNDIMAGIRDVSADVSQISSASAAQSAGLGEISATMHHLDELTQENAKLVEKSVRESQQLEQRAESLSQAIGRFRLQQGAAGEAVALVKHAVDYRKSCKSRDAFVRGLTNVTNKFFDRDMYVFALDKHGKYLAFGGNATKVGSRVQDIPGVDGEGLIRAIVDQCEQGPGWVEYQITNPTSKKIQPKMSYVEALDGIYVGCGVYASLV